MLMINFKLRNCLSKGKKGGWTWSYILSLKSAQRNNNVRVRWIHSEAQLGNALTKQGAKELELFYQMRGSWRIVNDPKMLSARKRRSDGLETLENHAQTTQAVHKTHSSQDVWVCVCPTKRNPKRKLRRSPGDESVSTLQSDGHASGAHRPSFVVQKSLLRCSSQGEISHSHIRCAESWRVL